MDKLIYGVDSETYHGLPMTFQFYSEDGKGCDEIIFVNEKNARQKFFAWCRTRQRKVQHVLYGHNLQFDLPEYLWGGEQHKQLAAPGGEFDFECYGFRVRGCYGTPTFCKIYDKERSIMLVDTFSFFRGSLAHAATLFCPDLPKLRHPRGLGEKLFTPKDTHFCEYAMRDSEVTYHIGKSIQALHDEFDLKQCVSVADLAARVFRHKFLTYTIPQPNPSIIEASLLSYHGGKNNLTVPTGWYQNVKALDVKSAYPHAMRDMPAFSNAKLYKKFKLARSVGEVPPYGVYCVSGVAKPCAWPVIFEHNFKPIQGKEFRDLWVQGFELNEGLRSGEIKLSKIRGHYYDAERDNQAPALRGFCDIFYARKEAERDKVRRYEYKLILNSLSGKFIQTRKGSRKTIVDIDTDSVSTSGDLIAGGMFHPFIASAITAHTRARIHSLEHKYKALHTATDGLFTQSKTLPRFGEGLGALACEGKGELLLIRNKLYVLYGPDGQTDSRGFEGKKIIKYALHGFQGTVTDLENLVSSGRRRYEVNKPNRLKESVKRGLTVNEFRRQPRTLKVGTIPLR